MRNWAFLAALCLGTALLASCAAKPAAAPVPPNGRVAVLMYHHLAPPSERHEEPGVITPERFESHLQLLLAEGYRPVSAQDFGDYLEGRKQLADRSVLITFDDGYASNYTLGYPLLRKYGVPAIIFPVMKFFETDGKGAWSPHLVKAHAEEMIASGLVTLGGHSYDGHGSVPASADGKQKGPWLTTRAWLAEQQRAESPDEYKARIRADLERTREVLGAVGVKAESLHFALPNGASTPEELEILRRLGFRYIYSTDDSRINTPGVSLIYRLDAGSPHADPEWLKQKLKSLFEGS